MGCSDWHVSMHNLWLRRPVWIYGPGLVAVRGNDHADRLASRALATAGLQASRDVGAERLENTF